LPGEDPITPRRGWWTTAAGVWLAVAVLVALQVSRPLSGLDTHVYWQAAREMAHGLSPYTVHGFVYPPFAAVLIKPLGHLGWPAARLVGSTVAVLAIMLTVGFSCRALRIRLLSRKVATLTALLVAGHLFYTSASLGNVSAVIAALLAAFYLATSRDADWAAGAVLGLSLAIKPLLLPIIVVPLLWARWRVLVAAAAAAAAGTGIGALLVPDSGWFFSRALPFLWKAHPTSYDPLNSTLTSVGHLAGVPTDMVAVARVLTVIAAAFVAVAVRMKRPRLDALAAVTVGSAALLVQFCAGGLTEDHFLLTLIPLFVTLVCDETYLWPLLGWPAAIAISELVSAPTSWYGAGVRAKWSANTSVRLLGQLGVLVALTVTAATALRRRRVDQEDAGVEDALRSEPGPAIVQA
jgi:arabinofuranan 3-O-arabinosyltransferase